MLRRQTGARTWADSNAVVTVVIKKNLRHATGLAFGLHHMAAVDAFGLPQRQAHAAKVVLADAGNQRHAGALASGGDSGIAALAPGADGKT